MARAMIWLAAVALAATATGCKKKAPASDKSTGRRGEAEQAGRDKTAKGKDPKPDKAALAVAAKPDGGSPAPTRPADVPRPLAAAPTPAAAEPTLPPAAAAGAALPAPPAPAPALAPPAPAPALAPPAPPAAHEAKPGPPAAPAAEEAARAAPEAPPPPTPDPRSAEPALDVTGYLSLADLELALKKKNVFRRGELAGLAPNPGYNALYFEPLKGDGFGIAVQVWRDGNLAESRTRFNTLRNTYPNVAPTSKVAEQGFRSFFGDVVTLVFADPRRPLVASVSCSKKHCTGDDVLYLATLVRDRLR